MRKRPIVTVLVYSECADSGPVVGNAEAGKDAESEEAQEHAKSSSLALYA